MTSPFSFSLVLVIRFLLLWKKRNESKEGATSLSSHHPSIHIRWKHRQRKKRNSFSSNAFTVTKITVPYSSDPRLLFSQPTFFSWTFSYYVFSSFPFLHSFSLLPRIHDTLCWKLSSYFFTIAR